MITLSGQKAEVRWSYRLVAELADWSVVDQMFSARIVSCDPVQLEQGTLTVHITNREPFPPVRRRLTEVTVSGGTFIARLGPKED
jgi:hypothetical protein